MTPKAETAFWDQMMANFLFFVKYIDPVLLLLAFCGTAFLFALIIVKKKEIRYPTTTVIAICWLLSADIAFLCCQMFVDLAFLGVMRLIYHDSAFACYAFMFVVGLLLTMQGYVQAVISVERLLAVVRPLQVKMYITKLRMVCLLCLATAVSAGIAYGYVQLGFIYKEHPKKEDVMICSSQELGLKMAIFILLAWVLPPATVTTICTIGITTTLVSRGRQMRTNTDSQRLSSPEKRLSLMLVGMNIIFVLTSIPLSISYFSITAYHSSKMKFFWNLSVFCTRFGSFTDWIIILVIGSQIRNVLRKICGMQQPDVSAGNSTPTAMEVEHHV